MISDILPLLLAGDLPALLALFAGEPVIDAPRTGRLAGQEAFTPYTSNHEAWFGQPVDRVEPLQTVQTTGRIAHECLVHIRQDQEAIALPVALVGDLEQASDSRRFTFVRLYHSQWPLFKTHFVRPPILPKRDDLFIPDVVGRYQAALARGDLEGVLAQFEANGLAREPSGGKYVYRGKDELRHFYGMLFTSAGPDLGIPLEHCTITDDGVCCAIEYNVTQVGRIPVPPQAGVAFYQRGPGSLLAAARIYDDVTLPG